MEGFRVVCGMRGGRLPLPGAGVSVGVLAIDFRGFQGQEGGHSPWQEGAKACITPSTWLGGLPFARCRRLFLGLRPYGRCVPGISRGAEAVGVQVWPRVWVPFSGLRPKAQLPVVGGGPSTGLWRFFWPLPGISRGPTTLFFPGGR